MDVLKLSVDGGKTDIGDPIEAVELLHDLLSDFSAFDLPFSFFLKIGLNPVDALLDDIDADGSFFTGLLKAIEDFNPIKRFSSSIFLDDQRKGILCPFTRGKTFLAFEAFPPAADRLLVFSHAGINDFAFWMITERAFHLLSTL